MSDIGQPGRASVLKEMTARGLSVQLASDVLIDEFGSSSAAFICARSDAVFACIPIPATAAMRECVLYQRMPGLPDIAQCELDYGVDVFVPRLVDDDGRSRNALQLPWLNLTCRRLGQG